MGEREKTAHLAYSQLQLWVLILRIVFHLSVRPESHVVIIAEDRWELRGQLYNIWPKNISCGRIGGGWWLTTMTVAVGFNGYTKPLERDKEKYLFVCGGVYVWMYLVCVWAGERLRVVSICLYITQKHVKSTFVYVSNSGWVCFGLTLSSAKLWLSVKCTPVQNMGGVAITMPPCSAIFHADHTLT